MAAFVVVWLGATGLASADDAVAILFHGGVTEAPVYEVSGAEPGEADRTGALSLVDESLGSSLVRDMKVLPDSGHLLSDVSGRGLVRTDADGAPRFVLDEEREYERVDTASVLAYASPGAPERILLGESGDGRATLIDLSDGETLWEERYYYSSIPPDALHVIALYPDRAAVAAHWSELSLSVIDLYEVEVGYPTDKVRRLANVQHDEEEAGAEVVEVEALSNLRDVKGLDNGNLLVTTRSSLIEVEPDGSVAWRIDRGDSEALGGEFAAAVSLPSGDVAVATFEPGVWTQRHNHHRVHWLRGEALEEERVEVIASTVALEAAPAKLDRAGGHGGSGSADYEPGLGSTEGDPNKLALEEAVSLNTEQVERGEMLWSKATLTYDGEEPLSLRRVQIAAHPGSCSDDFEADDDEAIVLAEEFALTLQTGQNHEIIEEREVDASFGTGSWCALVWARMTDDSVLQVGDGTDFRIVDASQGGVTDKSDLDYHNGGREAGDDDASWSSDEEQSGCSSTRSRPPAALFIFVMLYAARRRVRQLFSSR